MSGATLYAKPKFKGDSIALEAGSYRLHDETDFNDASASVRVEEGYCVILHEHANDFGGYGTSIALISDCDDLSKYGFDHKASFVQVFSIVRDKFFFFPGHVRDGKFIHGHWQRTPSGGLSAVISDYEPTVCPPVPEPTKAVEEIRGIATRDHRGEDGNGWTPPPEGDGDGGIIRDHRSTALKHIIVLVLENRSFDHMLGFSKITGKDAATGGNTAIDGLTGSETNTYQGITYHVLRGAPDVSKHDPGHGFNSVLEQLCGEGAAYPWGGPYPAINNSGFVSNYARAHPDDPSGAMRCYGPEQVPVLTELAKEFLVCDRWFSSMPGPTEPNRWFIHAADADWFDESPSNYEIGKSQTVGSGFSFEHGSIFQLLSRHHIKWRIYACDGFPNVSELDGVSRTFDVDGFNDFLEDIQSPEYDASYTFIEPSYDVFDSYKDGNSQHPLGSAKAGEMLIKRTYEALRKSPKWGSSMLIVTYDEHGGFYDHVAPPPTAATNSVGKHHGFTFDQCGPRVPAIVISPLIPKNLIDHRQYEHASIIATLIDLFDLEPLAPRSSACSSLKHLITLEAPRPDAPMTLTDPMNGAVAKLAEFNIGMVAAAHPNAAVSEDTTGNIAGAVRGGLNQHLQLTPPDQHAAIRARVQAIQTQGQALNYLKEVDLLVKQARVKAGVKRTPKVRDKSTPGPAIANELHI